MALSEMYGGINGTTELFYLWSAHAIPTTCVRDSYHSANQIKRTIEEKCEKQVQGYFEMMIHSHYNLGRNTLGT